MTVFTEQRLPVDIRLGMVGGPQFRTEIVETRGGREQRNSLADAPRRRWQIQFVRTSAQLDTLYSLFLNVSGSAIGFRIRDPFDYTDAMRGGSGLLGTGVGDGTPTKQMVKRYTAGALTHDETITKPVSTAEVTASRNGSPVAYGASAGEVALDTTTGIFTFVADDSETITGHTVGTSHVFTTAADIGLSIGDKVYITGVTGTAATLLNSIAHEITNKTGAGPYTWTTSTNTGGSPTETATGGTAFAYPQADDTLTWAGNYDRPVRFATDRFDMRTLNGDALFELGDLEIVELLP